MSNSTRFVGLRAMADGSLLRTATLYDTEYLVVPIVSAVGDQVWWPANSSNPELVPASVLESAFWSRNNRPIVAGHPRVNGEYVSANSPEILEKYSYGHLFAAEFDNKRVKVEAWFNKKMAENVGPDAINVISRLEKGQQIEVSEGNMVVSELKEGELDGKPYKSVWLSAICDHLATVSEGACNNEMGCGGPRVNQISTLSVNEASKMSDKPKKDSKLRRLFASMTSALKDAMSNNELRMKLFKALSEAQSGVSYVYDEDVETRKVIYCVIVSYGDYWDDREYEYHFYRRSFDVTPEGVVSLTDDTVEVEWFEGWKDKGSVVIESESLTASGGQPENRSSCQYQKEKEDANVNVNEKKALITKLIGAAQSPFGESNRAALEGMTDENLTFLMSAYEGEVQITTPPATPETVAASVVTPPVAPVATDQVILSKEEYEEIKASSNAHKAQQEAHRTSLISSLKSAQSAFTEDDLKKMDILTLEKLATSLNVNEPSTVDYSVRGRGVSRVSSGTPTMRDLPNPWGIPTN